MPKHIEAEDFRKNHFNRASVISGLVSPAYGGECISNLPDSFFKILGVSHRRPLKIDSLYGKCESTENLIFILLDGLGYNLIRNSISRDSRVATTSSKAPTLESFIERSLFLPITSVFPSTTSTATTTLHTGLTPLEHGILGYTMYLQEVGAVAEMLRFAPLIGGRGISLFDFGNIDPETFLGSETIHEKLANSGIISNLYISKWITDSGLSKLTNRGARLFPHVAASDMLVRLRRNLESGEGGSPSFHFAYFASPDTVAHVRGPFSEEYSAEVDALFYQLERDLIERLPVSVAKKTSLIISADHGLVNVSSKDVIDMRDHSGLRGLLKLPPTGDSRAVFLHAKEGAAESIRRYFDRHLRGKFHVMDSKELLVKGLLGLGIMNPHVQDRIGTLAAVPLGLNALDNSDIDPRREPMPGRHGGMSEDEMLVPLVARKLSP